MPGVEVRTGRHLGSEGEKMNDSKWRERSELMFQSFSEASGSGGLSPEVVNGIAADVIADLSEDERAQFARWLRDDMKGNKALEDIIPRLPEQLQEFFRGEAEFSD